jgi:paraquat-inducible protein B
LSNPEAGRALIDQGLRGQLQMESFVTGLLYVGLDLVPGSPAHFVQSRDSEVLEIPTLPTTLEKAQDTAVDILARLEEIDFKGLIESVTRTVDGMNRLANAPEFRSAARSFEQTMPKVDAAITSLRDLTIALGGTVRSLSGDLQQTSAETRLALKQAAEAMKQAGETMKRAEAAAAGMQAVVDPDSPTFYELTKSLREVSSAARSLRLLANYLERNPRALIFGKPEAKQE